MLRTNHCSRLIALLFPALLFAQNYSGVIKGHITDAENNEPLYNVNVYISNSLLGAATGFDGYFEIKNIPPGTHELVVSIVGYQYVSKSVWVKKGTKLKLDFKLTPLIYETETIHVEAENADEWKSDLEDFVRIFFADSPFASQTRILNPEILDFAWSDNGLAATARQPLKIENNALGYIIDCILQEFVWDPDKQQWSWSIKPRFNLMDTKDPAQQKLWDRNRVQAYEGSMYHFLRALVNRRLKEEGFNIYAVDNPGERISRLDFRNAIFDYKSILKPGIIASETVLEFPRYLFVVYQNSEYSWIKLNMKSITLDENGYPQDNFPFSVNGYWAKQGVADLLPRYANTKK